MARSAHGGGTGTGRVRVVNRQRLIPIRRGAMEAVLEGILRDEDVPAPFHVDVTLVRDGAIRPVHRDHLGKDTPADVLAFPYHSPESWSAVPRDGARSDLEGEHLLGDVLVSTDQARVEARRRRIGERRAVALLAIHGVLHLMGYDHAREAQRRVMKRAERRYIGLWLRWTARGE